MKSSEKEHQFIIARGITKKILANTLEKEPYQIELLYNQHGKPFINEKYNNYTIEFNISHSGLYGLIAITLDNKVGIDIQKIKPEIDIEALSNRFFSDEERNELNDIRDIWLLSKLRLLQNNYRMVSNARKTKNPKDRCWHEK